MLNVEFYLMNLLTTDPTLLTLIPAKNMFFGPIDVTEETQSSILMPQIDLFIASESVRSVPLGATDSIYQIDIWSRNNQLEVENIYQRVEQLFNFIIADQSTSHIFWNKLSGATDEFDTTMRLWHRSCRFTAWSI